MLITTNMQTITGLCSNGLETNAKAPKEKVLITLLTTNGRRLKLTSQSSFEAVHLGRYNRIGLELYEVQNCKYPEYNGRIGYIFREPEGYTILGDPDLKLYSWELFSSEDGEFIKPLQDREAKYPLFEKKAFNVSEYGFGKIFQSADLKSAPEGIRKAFDDWISGAVPFLTLCGSTGIGKTYCCCALMKKLHDLNKNFISKDIKRFLEELYIEQKDNGHIYNLLNVWKRVDYLILDDLGSNKVTDWRIETMLDLIDYRWSEIKPTFITSNVLKEELKEVLGQRIASRLFSGRVINATGKDKRLDKERLV